MAICLITEMTSLKHAQLLFFNFLLVLYRPHFDLYLPIKNIKDKSIIHKVSFM